MRIRGINQVNCPVEETIKVPPSHAPWSNRALVVPEFIFIGGRSYSGRLGSSAVSSVVDTVPKTKPIILVKISRNSTPDDAGRQLNTFFLVGVP